MHRRGLLRRAIRASISIPGVMPPVVMDGQVLVDGAVIKNFPTDVMRMQSAGPTIGVDMSQTRGVDAQALENPPSWWRWILSGAWRAGPPIVSILMRSATVTSDAELTRSRADTDLLIRPEHSGTDIRDWKIYDPVVAVGLPRGPDGAGGAGWADRSAEETEGHVGRGDRPGTGWRRWYRLSGLN